VVGEPGDVRVGGIVKPGRVGGVNVAALGSFAGVVLRADEELSAGQVVPADPLAAGVVAVEPVPQQADDAEAADPAAETGREREPHARRRPERPGQQVHRGLLDQMKVAISRPGLGGGGVLAKGTVITRMSAVELPTAVPA
jgi:hypothetical protein